MGVYVDVNIHDCGSQRCQIPRAGVTRGCEHQMRMLGNELRSSANPVPVLNYSVISPTLFYFCILLNCF